MALHNFLLERLVNYLPFEPTHCQRELFSKLATFMGCQVEADLFLITGYAGTGKTSAIASLVKLLKELKTPSILLAPTGRAAKVLTDYTGESATTIHKEIYREQEVADGVGYFSIGFNKAKETLFIVDEASLISSYGDSTLFGSGDLLEDLVTYVRSGRENKLILIGDPAQLPPVGELISNALNREYLNKFGTVHSATLTTVVRQAKESGILHNATILREMIEEGREEVPVMELEGFDDIERISGGDLIETISNSYSRWGEEESLILCRSNRRANRYNQGIRATVLYREERICRGDYLMVVRNNYLFKNEKAGLNFIANGDIAEVIRVDGYEERYGLNYAQATLSFPDYGGVEIKAPIILDTLESESANLGRDEQRRLYQEVVEDYSHIKQKRKRVNAVKEDPFFNALQIKHAYAITTHKSQGGQWSSIFIDNPFFRDKIGLEELKWLYTAITRSKEKLYFVNFANSFFK